MVEKTKAGKLDWQPTAEEGTFLAAVRGEKTFQISEEGKFSRVLLVVGDKDGRPIIRANSRSSLARELYLTSGRIALRIDENVDATIRLLEEL